MSIFETKICPVTGLKFEVKPHWQVKHLEYTCKLGIIAESIIIAEPGGNSVLETFYKFRDAVETIIKEHPNTQKFIFIDNYKNFGRASHKARKEYVDYLNEQEKIAKVIYLGLPKTLHVLVNVGAALNYTRYPVKVAKNYTDAITESIVYLKKINALNEILVNYSIKNKKIKKIKNTDKFIDLKEIADNPIILKYLKMLNDYIKTINWYEHDTDLHLIRDLGDNHPFNVLIETFFLIKYDISQVIRNFEKQQKELKQAHQKLKKLNKDLEKLVEKRTQQLTKANEKLKILNEELKIAKENAENANKNKTVFIASISHDLKTPLNAIIGYSSLGITKIEKLSKEKMKNYLTQINTSGKRLLKLITDLVDINKLEMGAMEFEFKPNNIISIINNTLSELSPLVNEKNIQIKTEADIDNAVFKFDALRISQVFVNIISNAIKFTPENKNIYIKITEKEEEFVFSISDEGIGIPEEELLSIFDIFKMGKKSNKKLGTGLGLAISKNIVNAHKGTIKASNNEYGGAEFIFTLSKKL